MRQKRVAIYEGTDLNSAIGNFVAQLASAFLHHTDAVLVTGGYDYQEGAEAARSTDRSVADAAEAFANKEGIDLQTRLETWLPEPAKDRTAEKVRRFAKGKVVQLDGGARTRRLRIVNDVDALVTVRGQTQTALVLDMALAIGKPALPLPFTGGDSADFWHDNKPYYQSRFHLSDEQVVAWEALQLEQPGDEASLAALRICTDAVRAVSAVLKRSCLVLMPFRPELEPFYKRLEDTVGKEGFEAIRLDHKLYTGDVRTTVKRLIKECDAIIADITDASPNVMYELGQAHADECHPLLLLRVAPGDQLELPFYLKPERIQQWHADNELPAVIQVYLESVRAGAR